MPDFNNALLAKALLDQQQPVKLNPLVQQNKFGQSLIDTGSSTAPVRSPLEGLARALQAPLGAWVAKDAQDQQKAEEQNNLSVYAKAAAEQDPQKIAAVLQGLKGSTADSNILGAIIQGNLARGMGQQEAQGRLRAAGYLPQGGQQAPQGIAQPGYASATAGGQISPAAQAVAGTESAGQPNDGYGAVGPVANAQGNRAYGKYQVLDTNIGPWTQEVLGKAMSPQEFLASPEAQNKVFESKFGQYVTQFGSPQAASRAWFAGPQGMNNPGAVDVNGMTPGKYQAQFVQNGGAPTTTPQAQVQTQSPLSATLRQQAQTLIQNGRYAEAEPLLKQAMEADGKFQEAIAQKQNETNITGAERDRQQATATPSNEQALSAGFADRMRRSNDLATQFSPSLTQFGARLKDQLPLGIGNLNQTPEYQQAKQARDDFINAQLRRESGAAIAPSEYANADKQYFPQPGDSPQVIQQKADNRALAVQGMIRNAGPTYASPQASVAPPQRQEALASPAGAPRPGTIEQGYRFKGGDPADKSNWERAQ